MAWGLQALTSAVGELDSLRRRMEANVDEAMGVETPKKDEKPKIDREELEKALKESQRGAPEHDPANSSQKSPKPLETRPVLTKLEPITPARHPHTPPAASPRVYESAGRDATSLARIARIEAEKKELEKEVERLRRELERGEVATLRAAVEERDEMVERARDARNKALRAAKEAKGQLEAAERRAAQAEAASNAAEEARVGAASEVVSLRGELVRERLAHARRVEELEQELASVRVGKGDDDDLEDGGRGRVEADEEGGEEKESKRNALEEEVRRLQNDLAVLEERRANERLEMSRRVNEAEGRSRSLEERIGALETELAEERSKLKETEATLRELRDRERSTRQSADTEARKAREAQARIAGLEAAVEEARENMQLAQKQSQDLQSQLQILQQQSQHPPIPSSNSTPIKPHVASPASKPVVSATPKSAETILRGVFEAAGMTTDSPSSISSPTTNSASDKRRIAALKSELARLAEETSALRRALSASRDREEAATAKAEDLEPKLQVTLELLGERDEEVEALREELEQVQKTFQSQINALLPPK